MSMVRATIIDPKFKINDMIAIGDSELQIKGIEGNDYLCLYKDVSIIIRQSIQYIDDNAHLICEAQL